MKPTGLAKHPLKTGVVFVLDRGTTSRLIQLKLSSGALTVDATQNLPANLPAAGAWRSASRLLPRAPTCCWLPSMRRTTASSSTS